MIPVITSDMCAAAYELLRTLPPFSGYNLPHADDVEFHVVADVRIRGWHKQKANRVHVIAMSENCNGHVCSLVNTMAHEMLHLSQEVLGTATRTHHNADFKERGMLVCAVLGFDPKMFM